MNGDGRPLMASDMTMRDILASLAITQSENLTCSVGDAEKQLGLKEGTYNADIHWPALLARRTYSFADAIIAENLRTEKERPLIAGTAELDLKKLEEEIQAELDKVYNELRQGGDLRLARTKIVTLITTALGKTGLNKTADAYCSIPKVHD